MQAAYSPASCIPLLGSRIFFDLSRPPSVGAITRLPSFSLHHHLLLLPHPLLLLLLLLLLQLLAPHLLLLLLRLLILPVSTSQGPFSRRSLLLTERVATRFPLSPGIAFVSRLLRCHAFSLGSLLSFRGTFLSIRGEIRERKNDRPKGRFNFQFYVWFCGRSNISCSLPVLVFW